MLLGTRREQRASISESIIANGPILSTGQQEMLLRPVSYNEVQHALFSIPGEKSPEPDGFGAFVFKYAWAIVGHDIIAAVKNFFISSKLLKELNIIILTLIPKVKCPSSVTEFRPIVCRSVVYKRY